MTSHFDFDPINRVVCWRLRGEVTEDLFAESLRLCADIFVDTKPQPHGRYRFTIESIECLPAVLETPFIASIPVLETTVRVLYPKDKMSVFLSLSFADQTALLKTDLENGDEWLMNSPILPGQCILVRWSKIQAKPQTQTS